MCVFVYIGVYVNVRVCVCTWCDLNLIYVICFEYIIAISLLYSNKKKCFLFFILINRQVFNGNRGTFLHHAKYDANFVPGLRYVSTTSKINIVCKKVFFFFAATPTYAIHVQLLQYAVWRCATEFFPGLFVNIIKLKTNVDTCINVVFILLKCRFSYIM